MTARASQQPSQRSDILQLMMDLRAHGVTDIDLLRAIETIPRPLFLPEGAGAEAYGMRPTPIGEGQEATPPRMVADILHELAPAPDMRVLEIGTGSGYQTALLSRLARRVYTMERHKSLSLRAQGAFRALRIDNIAPLIRDGARGWAEQAPFERIVVNGALRSMPFALAEQLKLGGVMLAPIVNGDGVQELLRFSREAEGLIKKRVGETRLPMMEWD